MEVIFAPANDMVHRWQTYDHNWETSYIKDWNVVLCFSELKGEKEENSKLLVGGVLSFSQCVEGQ